MADRVNWYFRQRVTQAEMDEADDAMELADRDLVSDLLGFGFVSSVVAPATVVEQAVPDLTVRANRLLGYDQTGRRLNNARNAFQGGSELGAPAQSVNLAVDEEAASTAVTSAGQEKTISVFVEFEREPSDPRTDGNNAAVDFVQDESVKFNVVQSAQAALGTSVPPPLRTDQLLLFDVVLTHLQTAIVDADIDQTRRQDFELSLPHGPNHAGDGTDPVPDATDSVSGLFSGPDHAKLGAITFDEPTIGNLFETQKAWFNPATITAPAASTIDVTSRFSGKSAGGASNKAAIVTQTGSVHTRRCTLLDEDFNSFLDTTGNEVFGEVTVDDETTPTTWTLTFYVQHETTGRTVYDMTPHAGGTVNWWVPETYRLQNLPTFAKDIPHNQKAGKIPDASLTLAGKVMVARIAGDKAGSLSKVQNGGVDVLANVHTLNFSAGAAAGPPGTINVTTGTGPTGPTGPSGPTGATGPSGPGFSSEGPYQRSPAIPSSPTGSGSHGFSFGFTVRFMFACIGRLSVVNGTDKIEITNVTKSGSTVTVNYSVTDGEFGPGGASDLIFQIGCSAAG